MMNHKINVSYQSQLYLIRSKFIILYMSSFIPSQDIIGKAFAIAGLSLVAPSTYFFRNYSRVLDYVQMFYVFSLAYASGTTLFSNNLQWSFLTFLQSFLNSYSNPGEFLHVNGNLISAAVCWFGVALLMLIILTIVACKKKDIRYHNFYIFWKGFFRWFSGPLAYYCTNQIITSLQLPIFNTMEVNFDAAVIVAAIIFVWMFVELIGHSCVQKSEENNWKKWCDFFSNFRMLSVMALVVVSLKNDQMAKYFIYGPIVIYDIVFLLKYKFTFKIFERFIFIVQEAVLITVFSLFLFNKQYIADNNLDLLGLALVILLQILIFFPKLVSYCKNGQQDEDPSVSPQPKSQAKKNAFNELSPELSRSNINENGSPSQSPRGKPTRR